MYILKNSIKNLFRNIGRNIIVAIIMIGMLTFTAVSMIISAATDKAIDNYREQFGSEIYLQYDNEKIKEDEENLGWAEIPEISDEVKLSLSESQYLKETMIHVLYPGYAKDLKGFDQLDSETNPNSDGDTITNDGYYEANLAVHGYNTPELLKDFKEGKRKITSGRIFETDYECVISEDFAKLNELSVGDKIVINDLAKDADFDPLVLTITGIYFDSTENKYGFVSAYTNPRNEILTNYETMKDYQNKANTKLFTIDATYYLKNPDMLEDFNKEAHEKGLHKNYKMSTDELSYNKIVKPAEKLANVSNIFLVAILLIGSVILILLSVLSISERKYEIGVLRAMGMKKSKVVRGILYESLITISLCLVIGLSIGAIAAQPVSDMITKTNQEQSQNNLGAPVVEQEEIKVSLTPKAVIDVSAVALILAVISSSVGVLYIVRYEPMKILSERN